MPEAPGVVDTRPLFRPVSTELVALLRALPADDWLRPTVAGRWRVRDVVAHLLDTTLRRLSFHRDALVPPPPDPEIASERDLAGFVNDLNAQWVAASQRLSPRVLIELYAQAAGASADFFEALPLDAPALFPVSWAGDADVAAAGWFDIGREFTELFHHQAQIRRAVGAPPLTDPRHLAAVVDIALRGLPHALRDAPAGPGETIALEIDGPSGGGWTLTREPTRWTLWRGAADMAATRVRLTDDTAWQLLFTALPARAAADLVEIEGRSDLGHAVLRARSVIV
jgi:uncharacterized protein (TIGR03083 family)